MPEQAGAEISNSIELFPALCDLIPFCLFTEFEYYIDGLKRNYFITCITIESDMPSPDLNKYYTYKDYLTWDDGKRWEIIEGKLYPLEFGDDPQNMSPAPKRKHQKISGNLARAIGNYLLGKSCEVYEAPFDVRFVEEDLSETVLQPDISVFCDQSKLDDRGAKGAPDWIIEILSPSTDFRDKSIKAFLYQKHMVKEYWLVDPDKQLVVAYKLKDGRFDVPNEYTEGKVPTFFDQLTISFDDIFS